MNQFQKYLKIKNISAQDVANMTGLKYHSVQKTIKGLRSGRVTRKKIADVLELDNTQLWSIKSGLYLRRLIKIEIERAADMARAEQRARLKSRFLDENGIDSIVSNG